MHIPVQIYFKSHYLSTSIAFFSGSFQIWTPLCEKVAFEVPSNLPPLILSIFPLVLEYPSILFIHASHDPVHLNQDIPPPPIRKKTLPF